MDDVASKVDGDEINGDTWKQAPQESQNIITDSGQALNPGDLRQLAKAIPIVVSNKAAANAIPLLEDGRKVFISSVDGGSFTMKTGAAIGTYNDNGGTLSGTQFTPGDGSTGFLRDDIGLVLDVWYQNGAGNDAERGIVIKSPTRGVKIYDSGLEVLTTVSAGIKLTNNRHLYFGASNYTDMFHNGSLFQLVNTLGTININQKASSGVIELQTSNSGGTGKLGIVVGGSTPKVSLYGDGVIEAETRTGSFNVINKLQVAGADVTIGAVDSGGAGFRVLRIPN